MKKMAVMYSFCRYFTVRLGTILVAISSMVQSITLGGLFLLWLHNVEQTCEKVDEWSSSNKLIFVTNLFRSIQDHTKLYLQIVVVFLMLHISSSALLIYAAVKLNVPLIWPYLVIEFVRLAIFSFVHFTAMMLIKKNILDLGLLIALSLSGGFLLLGLYYKWFCVVSLCQCVRELQEEQHGWLEPANLNIGNLLASDFKHLISQQVLPLNRSWGLQAVQHLRNRDYHYGNMARPTN